MRTQDTKATKDGNAVPPVPMCPYQLEDYTDFGITPTTGVRYTVTTVALVLLALVVIVAVETACMFAAVEAVRSRTSGDRISVTTQPSRTTGYDAERHAEK